MSGIAFNRNVEQKALMVHDAGDIPKLNDYLQEGWQVISVTSASVAVAVGSEYYGQAYETGAFLVILERGA